MNGDDVSTTLYYPNEEIQKSSHVSSMEQYKDMYKKSIEDPNTFWLNYSKNFFFKIAPQQGIRFYLYNSLVKKTLINLDIL